MFIGYPGERNIMADTAVRSTLVAGRMPSVIEEIFMSNAIKTVNVARNDTLTRIASRNSVSLEALLAANPQIRGADLLTIGQPVHIPLDQPPSQPVAPVPETSQQSQQPAKQLDSAVRHEVLPGVCACGRDLTLGELPQSSPRDAGTSSILSWCR